MTWSPAGDDSAPGALASTAASPSRTSSRRLRRESLPGYAPDLTPLDRGVWQHLKRVEFGNVCCADPYSLRRALRQVVARLRHKRHLIQGAIRHAGYHLTSSAQGVLPNATDRAAASSPRPPGRTGW